MLLHRLSVGTSWEYEYNTIEIVQEQGTDVSCGNLLYQVVQNTGVMVVIKITNSASVSFDTLRITNDSIINGNTISILSQLAEVLPYPIPVLTGPRQNRYPCFRFDDTSGYSYFQDSAFSPTSGGYVSDGTWFSNYGLVYLFFDPPNNPVDDQFYYYFLLQSFNGMPANVENLLYESGVKYNYWVMNPDSVIVAGWTKISHRAAIRGKPFRP